MTRQTLYPHITGRKRPLKGDEDIKLKYLPDSPEFLSQTIDDIGYRARLEKVVREAIARVNRR